MKDIYKVALKNLEELETSSLLSSKIIPWAAPVLSFGDHTKSKVATLGWNPSVHEFVTDKSKPPQEQESRLETIYSLRISSWAEKNDEHLQTIQDSCRTYFDRKPYKPYFNRLNAMIEGTNNSYYSKTNQACHLTRPPQPGPFEKSHFSIMGQEKGSIYAKEETQRRADYFHVAPGRG